MDVKEVSHMTDVGVTGMASFWLEGVTALVVHGRVHMHTRIRMKPRLSFFFFHQRNGSQRFHC